MRSLRARERREKERLWGGRGGVKMAQKFPEIHHDFG
jgi:hypothetical protein